MEDAFCDAGYDFMGNPTTVQYASLNEAVSVCNESEECGCVWYSGCDDFFGVAKGSGSTISYCSNPSSNAYVSMIKLFQNIVKLNEFF